MPLTEVQSAVTTEQTVTQFLRRGLGDLLVMKNAEPISPHLMEDGISSTKGTYKTGRTTQPGKFPWPSHLTHVRNRNTSYLGEWSPFLLIAMSWKIDS